MRRMWRVLAGLAVLVMVSALVAVPAHAEGSQAPVRGILDAHTHVEGHENMGGRIICGKPFHPDGIEEALRDCPDHGPNGQYAVIENFFMHGTVTGEHATDGYPTFTYWPAHDSQTHQMMYHTWLERAWRGGLRVLVDQLVANRILCGVYPLKLNPCDEMDTVRLEMRRAREMQTYIDGLNGGPGKGWFRLVTSPQQARQVIAQGKLAVVTGMEVSEPFGCGVFLGVPKCTKAKIDRGLDEVKAMGVSSMFLCHKFDNALCGVRFDGGTAGLLVNGGNLLSTGRFWQVEPCTGPPDNTLMSARSLPAPLGTWLDVPLKGLPNYPDGPHCNKNGLTALGEYTLRGMAKRGMIVEIDHMSAKAANQTLTLLEKIGYGGVISSHNWTDPSFLPRVYRLGGMATQIQPRPDSAVNYWRTLKAASDPDHLFGYGVGLDANGFASLPGPRPGSAVTYPFTSVFDPDVTFDRLTTGVRTWDYNTEGVANYGLMPDWLEDLRRTAPPAMIEDLANGPEAYLRMWERARAHASG
ncbi:Coagulation factor 5/8 type domain-containing protein [Actinocorallia sp. A-T 12471]|uniref:Coagulation factor 5/8 type domain-containing protein n=1 Tax=Actinocorallia sp. A-T 12471 TaxID=3089813 RepID=UPI0029CC269E|nr:Coagulation factor 5/8 type domain-containing protein [Actinocorallia sp. A-T 12471]MDX6740641.1 Coagulation factor 5/8 type domain-containing protein [Actinocorallia sp. A-T 12471]